MSIDRFASAFAELPLIAILRGIAPDKVEAVGAVLMTEGFRLIEVPLTSPLPFDIIARLVSQYGRSGGDRDGNSPD